MVVSIRFCLFAACAQYSFDRSAVMSLKRFYLRYYPPGLGLCSVDNHSGEEHVTMIDLLDMNIDSNVVEICARLSAEHEISAKHADDLRAVLQRLLAKLRQPLDKTFYHCRTMRTHILPLTNVAFDKTGARCITGSYDRTCRVWNVETGDEMLVLSGHGNVVFAVGFNDPICDKIITGSFDKTAKIWNAGTGGCVHTLHGHTAEVVAAEFGSAGSVASERAATASMDGTARVFDSTTGQPTHCLDAHGAEVIAARFSRDGQQVLTGSFDNTALVWDLRSGKVSMHLRGHDAELSNCVWNFDCSQIATGSLDGSARLWDVRRHECAHTMFGHRNEEILDVCFDAPGRRLATASSDGSAKVWSTRQQQVAADGFQEEGLQLAHMLGHGDEVSKVCFNPAGNLLLTASADRTACLWDANTGRLAQTLSGHSSEVFGGAFSYTGDAVVTVSKDNTCRVWR